MIFIILVFFIAFYLPKLERIYSNSVENTQRLIVIHQLVNEIHLKGVVLKPQQKVSK